MQDVSQAIQHLCALELGKAPVQKMNWQVAVEKPPATQVNMFNVLQHAYAFQMTASATQAMTSAAMQTAMQPPTHAEAGRLLMAAAENRLLPAPLPTLLMRTAPAALIITAARLGTSPMRATDGTSAFRLENNACTIMTAATSTAMTGYARKRTADAHLKGITALTMLTAALEWHATTIPMSAQSA
jgi:hypothetical protein